MSGFHRLAACLIGLLPLTLLASPAPPELDRLLVSFVGEDEGEIWLQGDYMGESLIPTGYGNEHSGIDFSKTVQLGGKYGINNEWNISGNIGLHDDQAWRSGEPQTARSQYQSQELSLSHLFYAGNQLEVSAHLGWRAHQADELFESAYSLENEPLSDTTTAYATNNTLKIDNRQSEQTTLDFSTHTISINQNNQQYTIKYRPQGDVFWFPDYLATNGGMTALVIGNNSPGITNIFEIDANDFPAPIPTNLPIDTPTTPYTYLTRAAAYDKGVTAGLTTSFYPDSRLRYSLGMEYRQTKIAPQFSIHPDLVQNTKQIANAARAMGDFIKSDATDSLGRTNVLILSGISGESTDTLSTLAELLDKGAASADRYIEKLQSQLPQANPWDESHLLLSASIDWWPYDDLGWAAEYTWYHISRSNYESLPKKISFDQTENHQIDGWMFVKPSPDLTLYLHGRIYSNFLLGDRPLLYNARVNHRFDDPFGHISAGIVWQF